MKRIWLTFAQAVTLCLAALFVISTLKPQWLPSTYAFSTKGNVRPTSVQATINRQQGLPSYSTAVKRSLPSVVYIFTRKQTAKDPHAGIMSDPLFRHFFGDKQKQNDNQAAGLGSGVIVSADGYILTNNHVVETADEIEVALYNGKKYTAQLIGKDPETDLAVLRIDSAHKLPAINFAHGDSLDVGDVVLAIGNPFGVGQTVTMGIVSALQRSHLGISTYENFIQTDAAINPGNSGGALVDSDGNLVGINAAIYSRSGGSLGIGFAIPVSLAKNVFDQIVRTGTVTRGWIGVEVQEITQELSNSFSLPREGALIAGVMTASPAEVAGIHPGDVLMSINAKPVRDSQAMLELIASLPPGQTARFSMQREGKIFDAMIQVGRRPANVATAK